jgi:hypothetical protein
VTLVIAFKALRLHLLLSAALAFFCQTQDQISMGFTRKSMTGELWADSLPSTANSSMLSIYVVK